MSTQRLQQAAKSPWLLGFRAVSNPRLRLFCFHHAGGNAGSYRSWATALPSDIEVLAVQLPGRGTRFKEPLLTRRTPLLDALLPVITQAASGAPFAFFGHSLGALIAFDVTCALHAARASLPRLLIASAHQAPGLPDTDEPLHALPDADFVAALRRFGGMPQAVLQQPELMELVLPILRADFELSESWRTASDAPLPVSITALGGLADVSVSETALEAWRMHTQRDFSRHMFPGDHFFLQSSERAVIDLIARAVAHIE
ncbi:thioesterase II family protein [Chondromyces crocatus]|uniref:Thioesterase n=1 Tax=Chondromyces crocatus TaxID=52 RepID=A0A0K1EE32_CHOCO|nr:alpha/beta fold hydrolase [Chondromyces crocatus]AKT38843.1 thioesterase [Chondromyces crocatus]